MNYLNDSSAWIEYLSGSAAGERVNKILGKELEVYTISVIISEVVSFVKRNGGNVETAYDAIVKNSKMRELTAKLAKEAGILHASMKEKDMGFSLVDAQIICAARAVKAKLVTQDRHFKSFKEAELI